jgi:hypothetical protein
MLWFLVRNGERWLLGKAQSVVVYARKALKINYIMDIIRHRASFLTTVRIIQMKKD